MLVKFLWVFFFAVEMVSLSKKIMRKHFLALPAIQFTGYAETYVCFLFQSHFIQGTLLMVSGD